MRESCSWEGNTYAKYIFNPHRSWRDGSGSLSAEDAEKIKEALVTLFENDESSARPSGSMEVLDVVWFAHNCKGGQYSSAKVHRSVSVDADGTVNVDDASIPGLRYEVIEGR